MKKILIIGLLLGLLSPCYACGLYDFDCRLQENQQQMQYDQMMRQQQQMQQMQQQQMIQQQQFQQRMLQQQQQAQPLWQGYQYGGY